MKRLFVSLLFVQVTTFVAGTAKAEEAPSTGLLYNVRENGSLRYECSPDSDQTITCSFVQISVRKKAHPSDLEESLKRAEEQYPSEVKGMSKKVCEEFEEFAAVLEGRKPAPKPDSLAAMNITERKDMADSLKLMLQFCKTKSKKDFLAIVKSTHEKKLRTCMVAANPYTQTFRLVNDYSSGKSAWVVDSKPHGACGIVELSRFEPEQFEDSKIIFWNYFARKAITNPKGELMFGGSCADLDQGEYPYSWRSIERHLGCDYIEFSVL
jgi:hypothetical protein